MFTHLAIDDRVHAYVGRAQQEFTGTVTEVGSGYVAFRADQDGRVHSTTVPTQVRRL